MKRVATCIIALLSAYNGALAADEAVFVQKDNARHYFRGDVPEVLMFHRALDQSEQNRVGAYLKDRYGMDRDANDYENRYLT